MATYGGQDYTGHKAVNLENSVSIRIWSGSAAGTFKADLSEGIDRAYTFPNKSGTFGVSGTFTVNLPAVTASTTSNTNVVVTGIRTEDGVIASMQNMTTTGMSERGFVFLGAATPANGGLNLTFVNPTLTATVYKDIIIAYTAVR